MKLLTLSFLLLAVTAFAQDPGAEEPTQSPPVGKGTIGMTCRTQDGRIVSFNPLFNLGSVANFGNEDPIMIPPATAGNCGIERVSQEEINSLSSDI
jgi:hypothetical protein